MISLVELYSSSVILGSSLFPQTRLFSAQFAKEMRFLQDCGSGRQACVQAFLVITPLLNCD